MPKHKTKGPLTLQGAVPQKKSHESDASLPLRVVHRDSAASGRGLPAYVHPSSIEQLCQGTPTSGQHIHPLTSALFLQLTSGSDCVLCTRPSTDVAPGCIQVDEVQQANLRLCAGEKYEFSVFHPQQQSAASATVGWQQAAAAAASSNSDTDEFMPEPPRPTAATAAEEGDAQQHEFAADAAAVTMPFELVDIDVEVRLLNPSNARIHNNSSSSSKSSNSSEEAHDSRDSSSSSKEVVVDGRDLALAFSKQCFGRVVAVNEYVVIEMSGVPPLLLRVTATNTLTEQEQQEAIGYHCFRGLLNPDTKIYLTTSSGTAKQQQQHQPHQQHQQQETPQISQQTSPADHHPQQQISQHSIISNSNLGMLSNHHRGDGHQHQHAEQLEQVSLRPVQSRVAEAASGLRLVNGPSRAAAAPATNLVHVYTSDGEWFPVKKKLLRPCIALTKVVRDSGDTAPEVHVPIDTLTFDRVLIFLEAQALGRKPPGFAIHLLDDLQQAAEHLGLRSLQDYCSHLKGSRQAALGVYTFADVQGANASGKVWLLLDGMVLDVGRWLPEHPGGAAIIPAQALNCDCSRFFELYHASRESFLYLQEFYIGELVPADQTHVPLGGRQPPSEDFMVQLREYTGFRQPLLQQLAQSVPATHLGAKRVH